MHAEHHSRIKKTNLFKQRYFDASACIHDNLYICIPIRAQGNAGQNS